MNDIMLEVKHLFCGYSGQPILQDLCFTVNRGEIISIIGPNGSGKTTLLKTVSNILKPEKGEIFLEGQALASIPRKQLARKVAVVNQMVAPVSITVGEYILLGRIPYYRKYQLFETRKDMELAEFYMQRTDIRALRNTPMSEISGGERQLASIARALVQEPALLLLDEPTSHLDITHQAQILDLIGQLNKELGLTVLLVMHDLNLASEYSDRLVLLDGSTGSIYNTGVPREVLTHIAVEDVYRTRVTIRENPVSQKPYIILSSEKHRADFREKGA